MTFVEKKKSDPEGIEQIVIIRSGEHAHEKNKITELHLPQSTPTQLVISVREFCKKYHIECPAGNRLSRWLYECKSASMENDLHPPVFPLGVEDDVFYEMQYTVKKPTHQTPYDPDERVKICYEEIGSVENTEIEETTVYLSKHENPLIRIKELIDKKILEKIPEFKPHTNSESRLAIKFWIETCRTFYVSDYKSREFRIYVNTRGNTDKKLSLVYERDLKSEKLLQELDALVNICLDHAEQMGWGKKRCMKEINARSEQIATGLRQIDRR